MDEVLKELAAWVASWVSMDEFTFETLFAGEIVIKWHEIIDNTLQCAKVLQKK